MKMRSAVLLPLVFSAVLPAADQNTAPGAGANEQASTTIRTTAQEVVLDMTFRDKKGKPVRDIRAEEIEIIDDGQPQKINTFRLIEGPEGKAGESAARPAVRQGIDPMREIRLVTLVFENLDVDGKRFFRQATKDLLDMAPEPNLYFSVYTIDQKLHCLQPFTTDHNALQKNVDRAQGWSFIQYQTQSAAMKETLSQVVSAPPPTPQGGPGGAPNLGPVINYTLAKMQFDMLQNSDRADREAGSRASLFSLMNMVKEQSRLPGRKIILYFNPWLQIPPQLDPLFRSLLSTANRSNVTFYAVDAKGLTTWSQAGMGKGGLDWATSESRSAQQRGGAGEVTVGHARSFDTIQDSIRANPMLALTELAEGTGGFLIADTNDWRAPLRRTLDEVRTYYEASYAPQIASYNGAYRKILVKVNRPDVEVHTRNGYFALPPTKTGGPEIMAFEMPLLNALQASPAPKAVEYRAAAHRFNRRGPDVEYMLTMEVPMKGVTFQPDAVKKFADAPTSLLAVVKDGSGEIVQKFSKEFPVHVPFEQMEAYKGSNIIQTWKVTLPPGNYTLGTVVNDVNGNKIAANSSPVVVPPATDKLALSQIVIVRRVDQLKDTPIHDAFYFTNGKIVPTMSDTLKGGPGNVLPFYFAVYPNKAVAAEPTLTMSFFKDGQPLGAAQAPLPKPDADGRIPYIANIPADAFTPGNYELRMTVNQGSEAVEEKIAFKVE